MKSRRDFLRIGVTTLGAAGAIGGAMSGAMTKFGGFTALASAGSHANAPYSALVCINLAGGNDGHNVIVPIATLQQNYNVYATSRLDLAIPQGVGPNCLIPVTTSDTNETYGFHPSMPELAGMFQNGQAAVLANVGMLAAPLNPPAGKTPAQLFAQLGGAGPQLPTNLFSHLDQSNQWQMAVPTGNSPTGWGGRMADVLAQLYNTGGQYPSVVNNSGCGPFCTGANSNPSAVSSNGLNGLTGIAGDQARINGSTAVLNFDNGLTLVQAANAISKNGIAQGNLLSGLLATAKPLQTKFPAGGLASQLKMVARIISVQSQLSLNRQIFFCTLGGFDTHGTQLMLQAPLLAQLSQAMAAFYQATIELGVQNNVTTFTTSEFGRTLMPNSLDGTDHAWGSHHMVMGGTVQGAKIYGQYPSLALGNPLDCSGAGALIPTTSVDQYAATMAQWFGVPQGSLSTVLPNIGKFPVTDLGFFG